MTGRLDLDRIAGAVDQLEQSVPARKLTVLRYLATHNGGRFDLPSAAGGYDPIIKSVELFGVYAMAEDAEELPKNWIKAARNILQAENAIMNATHGDRPPSVQTHLEHDGGNV